VCHARLFRDVADMARETQTRSFDALMTVADERGCPFGQTCGLCHPYVRAMLRDGRVVFDEILYANADDVDDADGVDDVDDVDETESGTIARD
jgi:hypothetical protein